MCCREMECSGGNLISDAMLARWADQGIQVSRSRTLAGIRASIDAGEVTRAKFLNVLPFQNHLVTFEVHPARFLRSKRLQKRRQAKWRRRLPLSPKSLASPLT